MKNTYIYSTRFSHGLNALARSLGIKRILRENSGFRGGSHKTVINWGASVLPYEIMRCNTINTYNHVDTVSNKLTFFNLLDTNKLIHIVPAYTTDRAIAARWLTEGTYKSVMCRTLLRASGGRGIVVSYTPEQLVDAPLYVEYVKKHSEYRVHIFDYDIIDIQRKVKRAQATHVDWMIRNYEGGFIFQREGIDPPVCVRDVAYEAFNVTGLVFGAVDVVYNEKKDRAYVLEINTAPGLQGQTIESYAGAIREYVG